MVDVSLIGTGALQPLPDRALASAAITSAGRVLLLDCGEGTQAAARRAGISLLKIDAIALTHYHGDHTYGLPGLLQSMGMGGRTEPVSIIGPEGLAEAMKPFQLLCPYLPFELKLVEMHEPLPMQSIHPVWPAQSVLRAFPTDHRVPSQGYRFDLHRSGKFQPQRAKELGVPVTEWKTLQHGECVTVGNRIVQPSEVMDAPRRGIAVAYTGDTAWSAGLAEAVREVDLLICEATYGETEQKTLAEEHGHMTFSQAARVAEMAQASALWLTHYSPMLQCPGDYLQQAAQVFGGAVCGTDGMTCTLVFDQHKD